MYPTEKMKDVFTIIKTEGRKDRWVRIGIGFINRDNSIAVRLDAIPTNGTLHIRDYTRRSEWRTDADERGGEIEEARQPSHGDGLVMEGGLT